MQDEPETRKDPKSYNMALKANSDARLTSARTILAPLVQTISPTSILDVGCGHGAWLLTARELGVDHVQGVDGPWIDLDALVIPQDSFVPHSLEQPLNLDRRFDLVVRLEVAEHLPAEAADGFVQSLVRHGDVILFSAAIPFQGGKHRVNEQWPGYWAQKFAAHGYHAVDAIRPRIWSDESVLWWLRQNTLMYLSEKALVQYPVYSADVVDDLDRLALVHPALYMRWVKQTLR